MSDMQASWYLPGESPMPVSVPDGQRLVHNAVYPVARRLGTRGSRWWHQPAGKGKVLEACPCGWAAEAGTHYRVAA